MRKRLSISVITIVLLAIVLFLTGCTSEVDTEGNTWAKTTIPWKDYESARYNITNKDVATGEIENIVEKSDFQGKTAYKMTNRYILKKGEYSSGATVSVENMKPYSSFIISHDPNAKSEKDVTLNGTYQEKKCTVKVLLNNETKTTIIKLPPVYYDKETILQILRTFPLKDDYSWRIRTCVLLSAKVEPFRIIVIGKEKVTVPAGDFNCYKVEVQYIGLSGYANIYAWYSTDSNRTLVKYQQGKSEFKLESIKNQK